MQQRSPPSIFPSYLVRCSLHNFLSLPPRRAHPDPTRRQTIKPTRHRGSSEASAPTCTSSDLRRDDRSTRGGGGPRREFQLLPGPGAVGGLGALCGTVQELPGAAGWQQWRRYIYIYICDSCCSLENASTRFLQVLSPVCETREILKRAGFPHTTSRFRAKCSVFLPAFGGALTIKLSLDFFCPPPSVTSNGDDTTQSSWLSDGSAWGHPCMKNVSMRHVWKTGGDGYCDVLKAAGNEEALWEVRTDGKAPPPLPLCVHVDRWRDHR